MDGDVAHNQASSTSGYYDAKQPINEIRQKTFRDVFCILPPLPLVSLGIGEQVNNTKGGEASFLAQLSNNCIPVCTHLPHVASRLDTLRYVTNFLR